MQFSGIIHITIAEVFDSLPPVVFFGITFGIKKNNVLILLGKIGSGGWDRTNDQRVILGHRHSYSVIFIRV